MSDDEPKPIKPTQPSEQPGTSIRKAPDPSPIKPAEPSKRAGTPIPFGKPTKNLPFKTDK